MPIISAENAFRQGLTSLTNGNATAAVAHFQDAVIREREHGCTLMPMRYVYLSYYGLSLALAHGATPHAIEACEIAARRDATNPDVYFNLSRVYVVAGKRSKAIEALELGMRSVPDNQRLLKEHAKLDRREDPPLAFLPRAHPMNKWLGRMRTNRRARAAQRVKA